MIKKEAEICPECGVRNEKPNNTRSSNTTSSVSSTAHDPSQYETTVSDTWWYGVAGGSALWTLIFALAIVVGDNLGAFVGFLVLVAWVGLPVTAYFDMKYVRANGEWNPSSVIWVIILLIWLINILAGAVYLYRRHEVLGEP